MIELSSLQPNGITYTLFFPTSGFGFIYYPETLEIIDSVEWENENRWFGRFPAVAASTKEELMSKAVVLGLKGHAVLEDKSISYIDLGTDEVTQNILYVATKKSCIDYINNL